MDRFNGKTTRPSPYTTETPMEHSIALAELVKRGRPGFDFLLLDAGMVPTKKRVLTAAGVEAARATLSGHHQLTIGLLHSASN